MTDQFPAVVHSVGFSFSEMERMAERIARSRLFGIQNADQALTLMLIAQAEGHHPALAARDTDIIQGKPAKKAEAMMRDFQAAGGKIEWHELSDTTAAATFSHPQGGSVKIDWDLPRAQRAGLASKDNWKKFARAMLRSRCVSEGVRTVFPAATSGMYVPEEVQDITHEMVDVTPHDPVTGEIKDGLVYTPPSDFKLLIKQGDTHAKLGREDFRAWFGSLDRAERHALNQDKELIARWQQEAIIADNKALDGSDRDRVYPSENEETTPVAVDRSLPERQAVEPSMGIDALPPADAFGLTPLSSDEAFCNEMLTLARGFTLHAAFDQLKSELGDKRTTRGKVAGKLPEDTYWSLVAQIDEIEGRLAA